MRQLTYKNLDKLTFPVYRLDADDIFITDGLVLSQCNRLIDDRNCPRDTLGARRLLTVSTIDKFPLKKSFSDRIEIIQGKSGLIIDYKGNILEYIKTEWSSVKYHKIKQVEKRQFYSLLWAEGISSPFEITRPPDSFFTYVGVLYIKGVPWMPYRYSQELLKPTRRKI